MVGHGESTVGTIQTVVHISLGPTGTGSLNASADSTRQIGTPEKNDVHFRPSTGKGDGSVCHRVRASTGSISGNSGAKSAQNRHSSGKGAVTGHADSRRSGVEATGGGQIDQSQTASCGKSRTSSCLNTARSGRSRNDYGRNCLIKRTATCEAEVNNHTVNG